MTRDTSSIGAISEAAVAAALVRAGKAVYAPLFGAHSRTDLVVEDAAGLHRVQCKTGRLVDDHSVVFRTCSQTGGVQRPYAGQVDLFGVHCSELGTVYLVPVEDVGGASAVLRVTPPRNGQSKGIRWAADYLVEATAPSGRGA